MSRLSDLIRTVAQLNPQLGKDLEEEIQPLQKRLPFGLNFERHAPEAVELGGHKVRRGSKVRILPPRGSIARGDQRLWRVDSITGDRAEVSTPNGEGKEVASLPLDDLVLVAEFRDRIYPGLRPDETVERGGEKPFHTVINGENFHVLELLTFTHEHTVDAIYIDPPYNTGARDWRYNNDYVEADDQYRHSKWLAFMERRLKLAKRLLKPDDSVLIVAIDEKEYLRLGLLLEQVFDTARISMVSTVIKAGGNSRAGSFGRSGEYIYFVQLGSSRVKALSLSDEWNPVRTKNKYSLRWKNLMRSGQGSARADSPRLFYPVFAAPSPNGPIFHSVGEALVEGSRHDVEPPAGTSALWPVRQNGQEGRWMVSPAKLRSLIADGHAKLGQWKAEGTTIYYLADGERTKVVDGVFTVVAHNADGSVIVNDSDYRPQFIPTLQWNIVSHDAGYGGARLLSELVDGRPFPFPKSLYAVEDALRFFVADKPNAVILDFFAGSGTTAHAVMRLNKQDHGRRQCISVTNNEVSAEEQSKLRGKCLRPGDPEWERLGICEYITKPRIRNAIIGHTPLGEPLKGRYKFVDEFPMSDGFGENAAFFTLTYESPWMISNARAFATIAPMLWLRAGAVGERIEKIDSGWAVSESYGVLQDLDLTAEFVANVRELDGVRIAYVFTDDEGRYQQVADELRGVQTVRLYEDYLRNCESTGDF